jgi:hypothetical protein
MLSELLRRGEHLEPPQPPTSDSFDSNAVTRPTEARRPQGLTLRHLLSDILRKQVEKIGFRA